VPDQSRGQPHHPHAHLGVAIRHDTRGGSAPQYRAPELGSDGARVFHGWRRGNRRRGQDVASTVHELDGCLDELEFSLLSRVFAKADLARPSPGGALDNKVQVLLTGAPDRDHDVSHLVRLGNGEAVFDQPHEQAFVGRMEGRVAEHFAIDRAEVHGHIRRLDGSVRRCPNQQFENEQRHHVSLPFALRGA